MHDLSSVTNHNEQVQVIFIDIAKVFDRVRRNKLLIKLEKTTPNLELIDLFADNVSESSKFLSYGDCSYSVVTTSSVVPQSFVLRPLLFSIPIDDVVQYIPAKPRHYTDNCALNKGINSLTYQPFVNNSLQLFVK